MTNHVPARRILVPVDFSPLSLRALKMAMGLGQRFESLLQLLYVFQPQPVAMDMTGVGFTAFPLLDSGPQALKEARERLKREVAPYSGPVSIRAAVGEAIATILRAAAQGRSDMVVMGTHGRHGIERALYGSTAEAVVRRSTVPVLTVHGGKRPLHMRRLLCPYNLTRHAERALLYADAMAWELHASLTVLFIREPGTWEEDAKLELKGKLRQLLGSRGSHLPLRIIPGRPTDVITTEAERGRYDAVVLCEHPVPWTPTQLLGTTAEKALRDCKVPVLSVPAGQPKWVSARRRPVRDGVLF